MITEKEKTIFLQQFLNSQGANLVADGIAGVLTQQAEENFITKIKTIFNEKAYHFASYNLIGIRTSDEYKNVFADWLVLVWNHNVVAIPCSTLPGYGKIQNPPTINGITGVAVLKENQYTGMWRLVQTKGIAKIWTGSSYYLQQISPCEVYRDADKNLTLTRTSKVVKGLFGINCHTWSGYVYNLVNNLSEGCIVAREPHFVYLQPYMEIMQNDYGNISFTLLHKNDFA